jgi:fumarylacetoacetate (FAA) hydrolase
MTRLVTIDDGSRDGSLAVVSADGSRIAANPGGVETMQAALDDWAGSAERLAAAAAALEDDGEGAALDPGALRAPFPRAYQWAEASSYHSHMERLRAARGIDLPPDHGAEPAAYNSGSDVFLGPHDPIALADPDWGLDIEATVAVVTDDVPAGVSEAEAGSHIRLVVLVDDLTHRNLLPIEYARGVGFLQAKPSRIAAPFAATPEFLGDAWDGRLLHATVVCEINGERLGALDAAADCAFDFPRVIAHIARTRPLSAGSIIGNGTVSNRDLTAGFGAIAEKRAIEISDTGEPRTPFLQPGDRVRMEAVDAEGRSLFGAMDQVVVGA